MPPPDPRDHWQVLSLVYEQGQCFSSVLPLPLFFFFFVVPGRGSNQCPLQRKRGVLTTGPPGRSLASSSYNGGKKATTERRGHPDQLNLFLWGWGPSISSFKLPRVHVTCSQG